MKRVRRKCPDCDGKGMVNNMMLGVALFQFSGYPVDCDMCRGLGYLWDLPEPDDEDDAEEGAWVPPVPPTSV